jgi:glycerophosphoryl diester phosphodiesterase
MNLNLPKLIGHRGIKDLAPENTLRSIYEAFKKNLKWVEIDVKISKDKIPFLLHDDTLERTTSGSGIPLNYKYSDIFILFVKP